MKIIYFSIDYCPHDHRFLSALAETEHEVFYVRLQRGARQTEDRPVPDKIQIVPWAGGQKLFEWRDLPRLTFDFRRLTKAINPDLIHAGPIQTCALIAVLSGFRPILTMSWGFDLMKDVYRGRGWEWATRYTLKRSTYFTSDAQVTRDKAVEYGMNSERTVVFPWGVDLEHFKPTMDNQPQTMPEPSSTVHRPSSKGFTLFCNRSWEPNYGVDVLARAFAKVAQQRPEVSLLLLGGGSQGPVIRQILSSGGVLDRVTFAGQISQKDLPRYYQMADLYISASHVDGSSVSLMEALACGLPCLVSDIPANQEWVRDDENGWLFPDSDHHALAEKILKAIELREDLPQIGKNARATAEAKANWPENVQKLLKAYQITQEVR
jgi:glycosyltransferase involved in cell wall biosynthesis